MVKVCERPGWAVNLTDAQYDKWSRMSTEEMGQELARYGGHPTVEGEHRAYAKRVTEERRKSERTANRTLWVTTVTVLFTVIGILVGVLIAYQVIGLG
jgi:hypothetical protein